MKDADEVEGQKYVYYQSFGGPENHVFHLKSYGKPSQFKIETDDRLTIILSIPGTTTTASLNGWDRKRIESMMMPMDLRDNDLKPAGNGN